MNHPSRLRHAILLASFCAVDALLTLSLPAAVHYENYTFRTHAGPVESPGWFDGTGSAARFNQPISLAVDASGAVFVADTANHAIRKMSPDGSVRTLAGLAGVRGTNDGAGALARFNTPQALCVDRSGSVYVADTYNHVLRKISPSGITTTLAGAPAQPGTADGIGSAARFYFPAGVAIDSQGVLYVTDQGNSTLRRITPDGAVTTFAGTPEAAGATDGIGAAARFQFPVGLAIDSAGVLYVADTFNHTVRKVTADAHVTTLAGSAGNPGTADGPGSSARFNKPLGIAVDASGTIFVADTSNHTLRVLTPDGTTTTIAGSAGEPGTPDGPALAARLNLPTGVAVDLLGTIHIADSGNNTLRRIDASGLSTPAGSPGGGGAVDGERDQARFAFPTGLAFDSAGNLLVSDLANHTIRRITPSGATTVLAGRPGLWGSNDGLGGAARFDTPSAIALDRNGNLLVADTYNHTIRRVSPIGLVTTVAGSAGSSGATDSTGPLARFNTPFGLAVDNAGNILVGDTSNHTIRRISTLGAVTTLAGSPGNPGSSDGAGAAARFRFPEGLAVDSTGNIYVADNGNHTIRRITPFGVVSTVAGSAGVQGADDGPGAAARFNSPFGLALDGRGNLYVGDTQNATIRKITPSGDVTTLAGLAGFKGNEDGTGASARFFDPELLAINAQGELFVSDASNHVIRKGYPAPADQPTVSPIDGNLGASRQFDVLSPTTASWKWSVIRQPVGSTAVLSSTSTRNPTFTPDVADLYIARFEGTDAQGRVVQGRVEFSAVDLPRLQLGPIHFTAQGVVISGSGGPPAQPFSILASTDPAAPAPAWTLLSEGRFDADGRFSFSHQPALPARYFRLRSP